MILRHDVKGDTMYDVDKVVEQLKTDSSVKLYGSGNSDNYLIPVKRAINIVKAAAQNDSNFKNDKDVRKLCERYMQQVYNQAILDFIHELDNYCGFYEGRIKNLTRDGVLEVAEQLRKKINDEACDDDNTANIEATEYLNDDLNVQQYLKHLSEDVFTVKIRERSTGRILELNPNIDNSFSDTMTRRLFHSGEYILISGDLPDKWK